MAQNTFIPCNTLFWRGRWGKKEITKTLRKYVSFVRAFSFQLKLIICCFVRKKWNINDIPALQYTPFFRRAITLIYSTIVQNRPSCPHRMTTSDTFSFFHFRKGFDNVINVLMSGDKEMNAFNVLVHFKHIFHSSFFVFTKRTKLISASQCYIYFFDV